MSDIEKKKTTDVALPTSKGRGMENITPEDITLPRIVLQQSLSPMVVDGATKAGEFANNYDEPLVKPITIQPIKYYKTRISWIPRSEGGGMDCRSVDGINGSEYGPCVSCDFRKWADNQPPSCDEIFNFLCIVRDSGDTPQQIAIVNFAKTDWKIGRRLKDRLTLEATYGRDIFGKKYDLFSKMVENDKGKFFIQQIGQGVAASDEEIAEGEEAYALYESMQGLEVKEEANDNISF